MVDFNGKYAFMTAYLKGEEARLVSPAHFERLLRAKDVPDAVDIIKDTDIGGFLASVLFTNFDEADRALWSYLDDCLKRIERFDETPKDMQKLIDAYMAKYDVLNIKAALAAVASGKKAIFIPLGALHRSGWLGELGNVRDINGLKTILVNGGLGDYAGIVEGLTTGEKVVSKAGVETSLDRRYYEDLFSVAGKTADRTELTRALGTLIDLRNLKMLLRGAARGRAEDAVNATIGSGYSLSTDKIKELALVRLEEFPARTPFEYQKLADEAVQSYGRNKNITAVGDIADRYEFEKLHDILSLKLMSPVMVIWYLILKETEIRNIRLVVRALFDNIPLEQIRDYLVVSV
jgi:V/A-type H+-transporting ATPase subunit C